MLPLMVDIKGKKVIIFGGGRVAYRKAVQLMNEGANLTIISVEICPEIKELVKEGKVKLLSKEAEAKDCEQAFLVVLATNDASIHQRITRYLPPTMLVTNVSATEKGNCHLPASITRGKLQLSISTNGASPMFAKKIKEEWQSIYDKEYVAYMDFLYEARQLLLHKTTIDLSEKHKLLEEITLPIYRTNHLLRNKWMDECQKL